MVDMGLQELRFLAFIASQLPHGVAPVKGKPCDMEIDVREMARTFNLEEKSAYREVKGLANRLMKKIIEFDDESGCEIAVGFISKRKYHHGEGRLWFRFDEDLLPHLMGLTEKFTRYRIKDVYQFKRPTTWRVYELLKQYKDIGKRDIEVEEIKFKLGLADKYDRITNLRQWIIDPAIEEINSTSDIKVQYNKNKKGRKIVSFTFYITNNNDTLTRREQIRKKISTIDKGQSFCPELAKRMREDPFKVSPKQARELANLWSKNPDEAHQKLDALAERIAKGDIKSPGGYTFKSMKEAGVQHSLPSK